MSSINLFNLESFFFLYCTFSLISFLLPVCFSWGQTCISQVIFAFPIICLYYMIYVWIKVHLFIRWGVQSGFVNAVYLVLQILYSCKIHVDILSKKNLYIQLNHIEYSPVLSSVFLKLNCLYIIYH